MEGGMLFSKGGIEGSTLSVRHKPWVEGEVGVFGLSANSRFGARARLVGCLARNKLRVEGMRGDCRTGSGKTGFGRWFCLKLKARGEGLAGWAPLCGRFPNKLSKGTCRSGTNLGSRGSWWPSGFQQTQNSGGDARPVGLYNLEQASGRGTEGGLPDGLG